MKISFKEKILCIAFGIFLDIAGLELFLRLLGLGYKLISRPAEASRCGYNIFCLGESTTVGIGARNPKEQCYPKQLEIMLKKRFPGKNIWSIFGQTSERDINEMVKICKANNIKIIICSYPAGETPHNLNGILKTIARKSNVPFVDNAYCFNSFPDSRSYFSEDLFHPNEKGYLLLARNIYDCIIKNEIIK